MRYNELEKLKPYRITKKSSDGSFLVDDIIWISDGGEINSVSAGGFIYPDEGNSATFDFEAEQTYEWQVVTIGGSEFCRKIPIHKMTNFEKLTYSKEVPVDEVVVGMLLERIRDDVGRSRFDIVFSRYRELYKSMKEWLESEAKE